MSTLNPNKILKEEFVSNLSGSSMFEISSLITTLSILMLNRRCIGFHYPDSGSDKKDDNVVVHGKNLGAYIVSLMIDCFCIVVPYILVLTVLAEWTYKITFLSCSILFLMICSKRNRSSYLLEADLGSVKANISAYRVSTMLVTCFCILAVDFKIFPRRYAKAETYGTGLMDLGVGSFVAVNSFVSRQARSISNVTLRNAFRSTSPLIVLGFARLISTASVNYQVHVGEYGVHWNFFFTLAAVAILTSVVNISPTYSGILGSIVLIGYQSILLRGLNKYMLSDERGMDIISQNKEGIFSIPGYWGMYLIGVKIGSYLFFDGKPMKCTKTRAWALCLLFWSITLILDQRIEKVSRRMCNLAYVSFVMAINLQVIAIMMLSNHVSRNKISVLEEAFNRNLLGSFLLANVLTGLVNLSIDTLSVSRISALGILFAYALVLSLVVGLADFLGIKFKFW